jgi:hypothetical protein
MTNPGGSLGVVSVTLAGERLAQREVLPADEIGGRE